MNKKQDYDTNNMFEWKLRRKYSQWLMKGLEIRRGLILKSLYESELSNTSSR